MDEMAESLRNEYLQLKEVEKIGSDINSYTTNLDKILESQEEKIREIRKRLNKFKNMITDEETLEKKFHDKNELIENFYLNNTADGEIMKVEENGCVNGEEENY